MGTLSFNEKILLLLFAVSLTGCSSPSNKTTLQEAGQVLIDEAVIRGNTPEFVEVYSTNLDPEMLEVFEDIGELEEIVEITGIEDYSLSLMMGETLGDNEVIVEYFDRNIAGVIANQMNAVMGSEGIVVSSMLSNSMPIPYQGLEKQVTYYYMYENVAFSVNFYPFEGNVVDISLVPVFSPKESIEAFFDILEASGAEITIK